jgi:hypothetical protein
LLFLTHKGSYLIEVIVPHADCSNEKVKDVKGRENGVIGFGVFQKEGLYTDSIFRLVFDTLI